MQGKIGLEETFAIPETVGDSGWLLSHLEDSWGKTKAQLLDFQEIRIEEMDKHGMELMVLSLNSPAIQAIPDKKRAAEYAEKANATLAEEIAKNPKRLAGFATLPMQDPDLAILELQKCIKEYGFLGALVNGFSNVDTEEECLYYDLPRFLPFWAEIEKLDVPLYLHPRRCLDSQKKIYEGYEWLSASAWGFTVETATHALRLMGSGLFDKHPNLSIILGHLGEALPVNIWRTTHRLALEPHDRAYEKPFSYYLRKNFYVTTSGNFRLAPLLAAILEMGSDRILFATDWPFETVSDAAIWFDNVEISETDREKIGRTNAIELLKLDLK